MATVGAGLQCSPLAISVQGKGLCSGRQSVSPVSVTYARLSSEPQHKLAISKEAKWNPQANFVRQSGSFNAAERPELVGRFASSFKDVRISFLSHPYC
jgi:hypothetical protein